MFKKMMLIGGAAALFTGSAFAADATQPATPQAIIDQAQSGNGTVIFTQDDPGVTSTMALTPDDAEVKNKEKILTDQIKKLQALRADVETRFRTMQAQGNQADMAAAQVQLSKLEAEQLRLADQASALMDRAQQQERMMPLLKQRDQLQLQLSEAGTNMGPKSAVVQSLQSRLQMLNVQLASMGEPAKSTVRITSGTLLGVSTTSVSEDLAQQLKLQPGFGLTVRSLVPGSPAESAGIKKYDVLTKLDDQLLITPVQLQTLIGSHKTGDEITLAFIHAGQSTTATTRLSSGVSMQMPGDTDMPAMTFRPAPFKIAMSRIHSVATKTIGNAQIVLSDHQLAIDQLTPRKNIFNGPIDTAEQRKAIPAEYQKAVNELLAREDAMSSTTQPDNIFLGQGKIMVSNDASTIFADRLAINNRRILPDTQRQLLLWTGKSHTLILTLSDGEPAHLLAKDPQGTKVFDGPVQTLDDQSKIPPDLREEYDYLVQHPQAADDLLKQ